MRHYHEAMHGRLPACAAELNGVLVETIMGSQNVVALKIAPSANPEHRRYAGRVSEARSHLDAGPSRRRRRSWSRSKSR